MRRLALLAAAALAVVVAAATLAPGYAASLGVGTQQLTPGKRTLVRASCPALAASDDAFVDENKPSAKDNGTALEVRSDTGRRRHSFVRFDLAACGLPAGANVESATLRLTVTIPPATARTYALHRVSAGWTESNVSWSTAPGVAATASATVAIGLTTGSLFVDMTNDVNAFATGTAANLGWRISDANAATTATTATTIFASNTLTLTASRPQLLVAYAS